MEVEAERFNMAWKAMKAEKWMVVENKEFLVNLSQRY
jgi:hypothetical protein